jgi:hypothetical protein
MTTKNFAIISKTKKIIKIGLKNKSSTYKKTQNTPLSLFYGDN